MYKLCNDEVLSIMEQCCIRDVCSLSLVCSSYVNLCRCKSLWKTLFKKENLENTLLDGAKCVRDFINIYMRCQSVITLLNNLKNNIYQNINYSEYDLYNEDIDPYHQSIVCKCTTRFDLEKLLDIMGDIPIIKSNIQRRHDMKHKRVIMEFMTEFTYGLRDRQNMSSDEWNKLLDNILVGDSLYIEYNSKKSLYSIYYEADEGGYVIENSIYSGRIHVNYDIIFKIMYCILENGICILDGKENIIWDGNTKT